MNVEKTRGAVIESLADIDPARNAAHKLRTQIVENLAYYHKKLQHELVGDFPVQFIEVPVQNRSQYSLIHPSIPMILVHNPNTIRSEGFSKFQAVQEGQHTPFITIFRNETHQAAYLHVAHAYKTYTQFEEGFQLTNTRSVNDKTEWLSVLGVFVYQAEASSPWDKECSNSEAFPVAILADHIIGINPHGWLWTERSLAKRRMELEKPLC